MEYLNFNTLVILLPFLFLAGFVDSIGGGGGLISLPAFIISGLPIHFAIGTNKLQAAAGTTLTTLRFIKNRYVNFKIAVPSITFAVLGSVLGSNFAIYLNEEILNKLLLIILPISAFLVLNKRIFKDRTDYVLLADKKTYITASISAFFIGIYDGLYGPGTGTFLIIAFIVFAGMNTLYANAHAKVINLTTNIAALSVFLINGKVIISLGLLGAIFNMAGAYLGSSLALKNASKITRPIIIFVLIILALKVLNVF